MTYTGSDRPARDVLAHLRAQYPESPFLALGQTVFWDEPVKAALRRLLDDSGLGGQMVVGVHDTDYFAKTTIRRSGQKRFVLMPHNDGTTKTLWSAAGEISTLFGSETFPSRHEFVRCGVAFEKVAGAAPEGRQAFLDAMTEAWGWRGLVYTGSRDLIVNSISLKEVGDGVIQMLTWGFENAIDQVVPGCCHGEARKVAETIVGWCRSFRAENPDKTLSHLFQYVLPKLYELLLGRPAENTTVTSTTDLLRLTPETAALPRFRFVDLFLKPETRELAISAYNEAVSGSEIYTLDKFGAGALPFDVLIPEHGRGTLRVTPRVLFVETPQPIAIGLKRPIESIHDLAEALHHRFQDRVTLVGKAVSLISMLSQEFIFVFNEEGSMYVWRTRRMNDILSERNVPLDMRPLLRLRYNTWDALSVANSTLRPPRHLAAAFGRKEITAQEFAAGWRNVVAEQRDLCARLAELKKPAQLLEYLRDKDPVSPWEERLAVYDDAKATLVRLRGSAAAVKARTRESYARLVELKRNSQTVQQEMGVHYRCTEEWTPEEHARRRAFEQELQRLERDKRAVRSEIVALKSERWAIERGQEATAARSKLVEVEDAAELERLRLVRYALLTIEGLTHTNHRPSAWWLPMVDSCLEWFRRIAETTEAYTEPLLSHK